jgi:hypothetical protein
MVSLFSEAADQGRFKGFGVFKDHSCVGRSRGKQCAHLPKYTLDTMPTGLDCGDRPWLTQALRSTGIYERFFGTPWLGFSFIRVFR